MKPIDVANLLNISSNTVRSWSNEYREFLSPSGQGGNHRNRSFTDQDVRIIALIHMLKRNNARTEEVHATLRQYAGDDWEGLPPMPSAEPGVAPVPVIPTAAADAALLSERRGMLREIATLQERIERLEEQLEAEREKTRVEREEMIRQLTEARFELRLYQQGRLRPDGSSAPNPEPPPNKPSE